MTYSILAFDRQSGEIGAAFQSHFFNVATRLVSIEAGLGASVAQMMAPKSASVRALSELRSGATAESALDAAVGTGDSAGAWQLGVIDARGRTAAYTGSHCVDYSAHVARDGVSAQSVMCASAEIPSAMIAAYGAAHGALAERLIAALGAAESLGGDLRGQRGAGLMVVSTTASTEPSSEVRIDLRVEDHPQAVRELARLVRLERLHRRANEALEAAMGGHVADALATFDSLHADAPEDPDIAFRHALVLALTGDAAAARKRLQPCYDLHDGWRTVVKRLPAAGFLPDDAGLLNQLLRSD